MVGRSFRTWPPYATVWTVCLPSAHQLIRKGRKSTFKQKSLLLHCDCFQLTVSTAASHEEHAPLWPGTKPPGILPTRGVCAHAGRVDARPKRPTFWRTKHCVWHSVAIIHPSPESCSHSQNMGSHVWRLLFLVALLALTACPFAAANTKTVRTRVSSNHRHPPGTIVNVLFLVRACRLSKCFLGHARHCVPARACLQLSRRRTAPTGRRPPARRMQKPW